MLRRKGQAKHKLQPPETAAGHPVTCTRCSCSGQHLCVPSRVFWSRSHGFFSLFPSYKKKQLTVRLSAFGKSFFLLYFLSINSMLASMENNIGNLTLQPVVSYSLSAIPQLVQHQSFPLPALPRPGDPVSGVKRQRDLQILPNSVLLKLLERN